MKLIRTIASIMTILIGTFSAAAQDSVLKELAPSGKLRVGVAFAPSPTPIFVTRDASGDVHGVPSDIGKALAKELGVPVEIVSAATTAELTEAVASGAIDIGFMPADDERRIRVDFSPPYFVIQSTFLAAGSAGIKTRADVDRPEITVVGIAGSTTMRAAGRSLKNTRIVPAKSVDEAMAMMKTGAAQAFALTHDALPPLQKTLPVSRILDGAYQITGVCIALQKNHPAALAFVTNFIQNAKTNGIVRRAFDDAGLSVLDIAP